MNSKAIAFPTFLAHRPALVYARRVAGTALDAAKCTGPRRMAPQSYNCLGWNERAADADCRGGQFDVAWDRDPLGVHNAERLDRFRIFFFAALFFRIVLDAPQIMRRIQEIRRGTMGIQLAITGKADVMQVSFALRCGTII